MAYKTFGELRSQVERELDIEDEEFIQDQEIIEYFNSAIRVVESEIIKLGLREKYLQGEDFISVVSGTKDYDLPDDIIDSKIRKIIYRDGTLIYPLKPLVSEDAYEAEDVLNLYSNSDIYKYMLYKNSTDDLTKIRLVPVPTKTVSNALRVIYFRDLNRYTTAADEVDTPEICYEYILSYVRFRCNLKEGHENTASEKTMLDELLKLMRDTLQGQVADPEVDLIDQDLSHYSESS